MSRPAAGLLDVPILLVGESLPPETVAALNRLKPATIYVVGGTGVVSESIKGQLVLYTDSKSPGAVIRLSGIDRYATNVAVVKRFWPGTAARSAVATGLNYPDALAEAPYQLPLHLVQTNAVPSVVAADIARLDPDRIDALGGPAVISDSVLNTLRAL